MHRRWMHDVLPWLLTCITVYIYTKSFCFIFLHTSKVGMSVKIGFVQPIICTFVCNKMQRYRKTNHILYRIIDQSNASTFSFWVSACVLEIWIALWEMLIKGRGAILPYPSWQQYLHNSLELSNNVCKLKVIFS